MEDEAMEGAGRKEGALQSSREHHRHGKGSGAKDLKGNLPNWRGTNPHLLNANPVQELYQSLYVLSFCLINREWKELNNVFVYAIWL